MTRSPLIIVALCGVLSGCSLFGYHRYTRPPRAPAEEATRVRFPSPGEGAMTLDGPALAALQVALSDFLPPGAKASGPNEALARCLSRQDTYDVTVVKQDALHFVFFTARLDRCGIPPEPVVLDIDAAYAIDAQGRIVDVN
ncbi:hypothetical protein HPP05_33225 [Corallococcus exiguus]|uniref:hypothetical protein n=1 Tax=Corallococcus exiguus TaxID=83462 RepID=UPI0014940E41|nr:hypothetical protein [Corallococcus exiguus]NPC74625.1 hypothetical protein [Corallococcus exiguus]NRD50762.1 hypothetical protein [Corallococcus exiguus]